MTSHVHQALTSLLDKYVTYVRDCTGRLPSAELDNELEDWAVSAPVVSIDQENSLLYWQPAPHGDLGIFTGLEQGLGVSIQPSLKAFYGSYWSNGIPCQSPIGPVHLLQVWNQADLEMLRENLLGHAFMKMKKRQPLTLFVGVAEGDDVVVIDNSTGEVYLEIPGRRPHRKLTNTLAEFLDSLEMLPVEESF